MNLYTMLMELQNEPSTLKKVEILEKYKSVYAKHFFTYTLNDVKYGIKKTPSYTPVKESEVNFGDMLNLLDKLGSRELTGNAAIDAAIPMKMKVTGGHPSKRTYQAIRIELNRELDVLRDTLDEMIDLLNEDGRICIITFHSLEDRIVKTIFKKNENPCTCPSNFPVCVCGNVSKGHVTSRKPIRPSPEELEVNSRSKSAKLRVFERK